MVSPLTTTTITTNNNIAKNNTSDDNTMQVDMDPKDQPTMQEGQPKPYGKVHPALQECLSPVHDVESLRRYLGREDPLQNWTSTSLTHNHDMTDLTSFFPADDLPAFYTPYSEDSTTQYHSLTFRELHERISKCPPFTTHKTTNVAILIPVEQMADMAMALLSIMAQGGIAVPLDPRLPASKIVEAILQLDCRTVVALEELLLEKGLLQKIERPEQSLTTKDNDESTIYPFLPKQVDEIRLVKGGICGRIEWSVYHAEQVREDADRDQEKSRKWLRTMMNHRAAPPLQRNPDETVILLRTSGTTATPKVVPISQSMLLYGAICIAAALKLRRSDCNANSMPFYHIGGISCNLLAVLVSGGSVLLAGPLHNPSEFLDHILRNDNQGPGTDAPMPTWYYAGPSMHKAISLVAEARWKSSSQQYPSQPLPNRLRLIRSATAHLNHDLALQLSTIFGCCVIPTYGMSEAMPICSSAPIDAYQDPPCHVVDSVGFPTGTSIRIIDPETQQVLPYNDEDNETVGEICVKGPGVITHYMGRDVADTHTEDGYLKTGDHGVLDRQGRLYIKGRSKEMIKRGGEQIWPHEIDDVVEKVTAVATAVSFGVPNELWGEEVAVAVVLHDDVYNSFDVNNQACVDTMTEEILRMCREHLDELSMPRQIKYLSSTDELLRGPTGKYIRSKMADHLGVTAVDTGALRILSSASHQLANGNVYNDSNSPKKVGRWDWLESVSADGSRVIPSDALNGVRFLVACFVVHVHVGLFPNMMWVKLQGYLPNMNVFFILGAFQITTSVARSVKRDWASFVGTKIGSLHALFVISQVFTFPSYVLFHAFNEDGNLAWGLQDWIVVVIRFVLSTATGLAHNFDINMFTWFQSVFYIFLIVFPFLDHYLRQQTLKVQGVLLLIFLACHAIWGILYVVTPADFFWNDLYPVGWTILTWLPILSATMLTAHLFRRLVEFYWQKQESEAVTDVEGGCPSPVDAEEVKGTILIEEVKEQAKPWGILCDVCSFLLFVAYLAIGLSPSCLCVHGDTYAAMRPGEDLPDERCPYENGRIEYVWACGVSRDEFVGYIQGDEHHNELGRFPTLFGGAFGYLRAAGPLLLVWIVAMAFGQGYTAWFFQNKIMTRLAYLGYPIYLTHMAVARYYWIITRGLHPLPWWHRAGEYPFPVHWYEFLLILFLSIIIGSLIDRTLAPLLMPHTISLGVRFCSHISRFISHILRCCSCKQNPEDEDTRESSDDNDDNHDDQSASTFNQVKTLVRGLTGVEVTESTSLRHLGLDSLGAAALLGILRSSALPSAMSLTLVQLRDCETVGDLAACLDPIDKTS